MFSQARAWVSSLFTYSHLKTISSPHLMCSAVWWACLKTLSLLSWARRWRKRNRDQNWANHWMKNDYLLYLQGSIDGSVISEHSREIRNLLYRALWHNPVIPKLVGVMSKWLACDYFLFFFPHYTFIWCGQARKHLCIAVNRKRYLLKHHLL